MDSSTARAVIDVRVQGHGQVSDEAKAYATRKIQALSHLISRPVLSARVRLTQSADPAVERPAMAQANLDLNGRLLRAHVAAATMHEAIDALEDRLREQLDRLIPDWESRRGGTAVVTPGEWRHGGVPAHRPLFFPRPVEQRNVVRHKAFSLPRVTPDEAALDMEMLDYDFHLFTDRATGQDSVLYRDTPTTYRLAQLHPRPTKPPASALRPSYSELPPPRLSVTEAASRLDLSGLPFVFFENRRDGRGNVLYHRYDGHYGLITPVD
ncbi:MAG: ribosome hibernation promotion factor [Actinomycetes bacterium]